MKEFFKGLKNKLNQKSFWLAMSSAVILLLQTFGIKINTPLVNEVVNAACAVFILLGVITDSKRESGSFDEVKEKKEIDEKKKNCVNKDE